MWQATVVRLARSQKHRGPKVPFTPLPELKHGVDYEIGMGCFDDPLARQIFGMTAPHRAYLPWPALKQPMLRPTTPLMDRVEAADTSAPIQTYLSNMVPGYSPSRVGATPLEIEAIEWYQRNCRLRTDLRPLQYRSFLYFLQSSRPIPEYFWEPDLTVIPLHRTVKHLTSAIRKKGGRVDGQIATRHVGGGFKRRRRHLTPTSLLQNDSIVVRTEHDPNRTTKIALIQDRATMALSYSLVPFGIQPGAKLAASRPADPSGIESGATKQLAVLPLGTRVFNIERAPGFGARLARCAGTAAVLNAIDSAQGTATVKLPSGSLVTLDSTCLATVGSAPNPEWHRIPYGKAGTKRNLGIRPTVRGKAMNPVDHPHGGGKGGKTMGRIRRTKWGKVAK